MYQILLKLLSPFIVLFLVVESLKKQGGLRFLKQRFGLSSPKFSKQPIWIHCASVGEVKSIEVLVKKLLSSETLLITTNTSSSANLVQQIFADKVTHCYLPFDWKIAVKYFLKSVKPKVLWVVETEIWPNLYQLANQQKIPITLINARLSKKTLNSPKWLKKTYQSALQHTSHILARSKQEKENFIKLGADSHKIKVLGNIKHSGLTDLPTYNPPSNKEYILLASSHEDEEYQISKIWLKMQRSEQLVIVPRHPKRIKKIKKQLLSLTHSLGIHSQGDLAHQDFKIFIDDRIGFLNPWLSHAKTVIMGGSFVRAGGHNLLEPAALKRAIITGYDMSDFEAETAQLKQANACIQCACYDELKKSLLFLLSDEKNRLQMGENAIKFIQSQENIIDKYLAQISTYKNGTEL